MKGSTSMSMTDTTHVALVPAPRDRLAEYRPTDDERQLVQAANDVHGPAWAALRATGSEPSSDAWKRAERAVEQTGTYTAGVHAWRSWLARTCPDWCTDDHRGEYPRGRINFEASHGMTVGVLDRGPNRVEVDISVSVAFLDTRERVGEPVIHVGVNPDDYHSAAKVDQLLDLVGRASAIAERIERGEQVQA
jgi:hypothetical protein